MADGPFFHVGVLVADLEVAMRRFHDVLGLDFAVPQVAVIPQLEQAGVTHRDVSVRMTYSRQGPPHLELIEAGGDGVWSSANGYGFHHIGAWTDDADAAARELADKGLRPDVVMRAGTTNLAVYFDPSDLEGIRFEACPLLIRDGWQAWVDGGSPG